MKFCSIILIVFLAVIPACKPSARFSSPDKRVNDSRRYDHNFNGTSKTLSTFINDWLHTPYKYGGMSRDGVDCSGFSSLVMLHVYNLKLPRTAENQYKEGDQIRDQWRKPGDLVFFKNVRGRGVDHVGVYLGENQFAHASASAGVIISDLDEKYYRSRYVGTCRFQK